MSRVKPADERRRRSLVLVVGVRSRQQSGSTDIGSERHTERDSGVSRQVTSNPALSPTSTSFTASDSERDPHNEVERRRKQRITRNIQTLAETLDPPCHCGKATRAEILEMVVKQIKELQQRNTQLQSELKDLPTHPNSKELSHQVILLIEENLRLRTSLQVLATVTSSNPQRQNSVSASEPAQGEREKIDGGPVEGEMEESQHSKGERNSGGRVEDERQQPQQTQQHGEERDVVHRPPVTAEEVGCEEEEEEERNVSPTGSSNEGEEREGGCGSSEGEEEREKERRGREDVVDNTSVGDKSTVEQPWPISSLLSDPTRCGVRDNLAFNLPILSPTYIAEHCSTAACEQQFFNPHTSTLTLSTTCSSMTEAGRNNCTIYSHHTPLSVPLSTVAQSVSSSVLTSISSLQRMTNTSVLSVHTLQTRTTEAVCSSSTGGVSGATITPRCHPALSHSNSPTTIVQPWVDSSSGSRATENSAALCSVTSQQVVSNRHPPVQSEAEHHSSSLNRHRWGESGCSQHRRTSSVQYGTNPQRPRHTVSRSTHSRVGHNREHIRSLRYTETGHNPHTTTSSTLESFTPNHTLLTSNRAHSSSFCLENHSSHHSTVPSSSMYTGNQTVRALFQPSRFPAPSIDPYYHQHSVTAQHHHNPLPLSSLCSPTQLPTSHAGGNPSHTLNHQHQAHLYQHTYHNLPPPTHPHHHHPTPPPSFTSHHPQLPPSHHPHPPSHHNTVWRPYSDRQRTSTRFSLSDILSPAAITSPTLGPPTAVSPHQGPSSRIPSFFVDHLLDDL